MKMAASKEKKAEMKETTYWADSFVDTLWDDVESRLSRVREYLEDAEDAYLKAVNETTKFASEYRENLEGLIKDFTQIGREQIQNLRIRGNDDEQDDVAQASAEAQEEPLQSIVDKLEKIAWTPWKSTVELIERAEKRFEENTREYIKYRRERRKSWASLTEEYISLARKNHRAFLRALEDGLRVVAGRNRQSEEAVSGNA
jgi:hypothetical protein